MFLNSYYNPHARRFKSGNAVITGAKHEKQSVKAFEILYRVVKPYMREKTVPKKEKGNRYTRNAH